MAKHRAVNQPTKKPVAKVLAALAGGLGGTFVLGGLDALDALDLPTFWDGLIATGAAFVAGYVKRAHADEA